MESWAAPDWNPCPGGLRHALTFRQVSTHEVKLGHQRACCSAKKKEPSSTSWVSVPRHKGDVQHNWYCDQVLKVNAESVRAWTEPLKQAIIFLRVGAVRTQDPQLGQLLVDLLKQLRFPHPVLIQSCLGLDHVFTQSWSCVPPPVMVMTTTLPSSQHSQHLETRYRSCVCITWKLTKRKGRVGGLRARWRGFTSPQVGLERALWS